MMISMMRDVTDLKLFMQSQMKYLLDHGYSMDYNIRWNIVLLTI